MVMPSVSVNKILEDYQTLTPAQQRQVKERINTISTINKKISREVTRIAQEQNNRSKIPSQKIKWKDTLINFKPNKYISRYEDIWQLESVLGAEKVRRSLIKSRSHTLDTRFIYRLFRQSPYFFHINQPETYLFSDNGELAESDGGPLTQLTALEALRRYGLKLLEESKEKRYVRL